ncbi:hypothetical protein CAI21_13330 [Alkalilimnicola ehrlichii]|uniref:MSHA biogenesis protein MshP n=1 Tax=Alkalilimnicola ehrlichii TaxID=351052 RepID=A0A3E0WRS5_9GAMM|nr:pilus assembly protein MshP [Alkalilimnicola ehrlichii]RFA28292.1 hypothetical protein CAI21_13330 [Alkalilimnicola ehrlichii]RFA34893.1 hypothetical protein CAL65_14465 [Alkalilimnicola ehrlichii]
MKLSARQTGFGLVSTLFVVVVLSLLAALMLQTVLLQSGTSVLADQSARAYYAAQAGMEWAAARGAQGACADETSFSVEAFSVTVVCRERVHEAPYPRRHLRFTATAVPQQVAPGEPGYVSRALSGELVLPQD